MGTALPHVDKSLIQNDLAYPAMLTFLPTGLLGLVVASILAAYISTMSTMLNLGARKPSARSANFLIPRG